MLPLPTADHSGGADANTGLFSDVKPLQTSLLAVNSYAFVDKTCKDFRSIVWQPFASEVQVSHQERYQLLRALRVGPVNRRVEEEETVRKEAAKQRGETDREPQRAEASGQRHSFEMDLSYLQVLEREKVLEVLRRDKQLRAVEEDRIRRMKCELQDLRRRGAKNFARQYGERTCARCQRPLGKFWNSGAVCCGCSHRICRRCRVGAENWKCTVCHAYREVKIMSGEWFLEEKAKKFPLTKDKYETVGDMLLKIYSGLSDISVVPPTPPPNKDYQFMGRSGELKSSKSFTKSMEDIMVSFKCQIRESNSHNDVRVDFLQVDDSRNRPFFKCSNQKSLSDTNINRSNNLFKVPSLPNLFKKSKDSDMEGSSTGAEDEASFSSEQSGGKRGSISSISRDCGLFDGVSVTGELELAVVYNSNAFCLEVTVGACRNLTHGDSKRKKCNPYVKLYMLPDKGSKLKTSVKRNTTDPIYNEVVKYDIERHLLFGKRLQASVWHSGTLKRKVFLGEVLIPLDGWRYEDKSPQHFHWYPLCPKSRDGVGAEQND